MGGGGSKDNSNEEEESQLQDIYGLQYDSVSTAAPVLQEMATPPDLDPLLEGLLDRQFIDVKIDGNQCCRMCLCQPEAKWTIHNSVQSMLKTQNSEDYYDTPAYEMGSVVGTIEEESPWLGRCLSFIMPGSRPITYTVKSAPGEQVLLTHSKGCTLGQSCFFFTISPVNPCLWYSGWPFRIPLCCCLPYMNTTDGSGKVIGTSQVLCDHNFCVPRIAVEVEGKPTFLIRPDTCAWGCCAVCTCDAPGHTGIFLRSPFFIRSATTGEKLAMARMRDPRTQEQLVKMGMFERSKLYTIDFPPEATATEKATLLGSMLLMDNSLFEQDTNLCG